MIAPTRQLQGLQSRQFYCKEGMSKLGLALEVEGMTMRQNIDYVYIQWNEWEHGFAT
jgi:hypothetical protein